MTSLSIWCQPDNFFVTWKIEKIILPDSIDDCNVGFGPVVHTGASMMALDNSHRKLMGAS